MQIATSSAKQSGRKHEPTNPRESTRDFRAVFFELDPVVLITADEFAALLRVTRASFDFRLHIGKIPDPVIRENRCVRWRVSDVRNWLKAMQQVPPDPARVLGARAQRTIAREVAALPRRDHRRKSDAL